MEVLALEFGLDDLDHLAQFTARPDRKRVDRDEARWPCLLPGLDWWALDDEWDGVPNSSGTSVSSQFGRGDVFYARFDYGDEWQWRLRVVEAGPGVADSPAVTCPNTFVQYPRTSLVAYVKDGPAPGPGEI